MLGPNYPKKTIYLAGPITGLTHDEARYGWRSKFVSLLREGDFNHIHCNSPMRGKEFLSGLGVLSSDQSSLRSANAMASSKGITTRDFNDVKNCDLMLAVFLDSGGRPSLGTAVEHGYAYALQKPIIAVGSPDDPNIKHMMLEHMSGYRVDTLEEAFTLAVHLLTPGI